MTGSTAVSCLCGNLLQSSVPKYTFGRTSCQNCTYYYSHSLAVTSICLVRQVIEQITCINCNGCVSCFLKQCSYPLLSLISQGHTIDKNIIKTITVITEPMEITAIEKELQLNIVFFITLSSQEVARKPNKVLLSKGAVKWMPHSLSGHAEMSGYLQCKQRRKELKLLRTFKVKPHICLAWDHSEPLDNSCSYLLCC